MDQNYRHLIRWIADWRLWIKYIIDDALLLWWPLTICTSVHLWCSVWDLSWSTRGTVQITINLTFTRVLAKSSRVRIHCLQAEVLHLLVRTRKLRVAHVQTLRAGVLYTYIRASHACALSRYSHSPACTRTVLASAALTSCEHSLHPRKLSASEC